MDYLVLTPPVCAPTEPPSGAWLLAAGLAGRGYHVGLFDLSLAFYHRVLTDPQVPGPPVERALRMLTETSLYAPQAHRTEAGIVHKRLRGFGERHPGWRLTMMDVHAPVPVHDVTGLERTLAEHSPFAELWETELGPVLDVHRPRHVLVSMIYLSQLAAGIDLVAFLERRGIDVIIGGPLIESLSLTGGGLDPLRSVFGDIRLGDGLSLIGGRAGEKMLDQLGWPQLLCERPYISPRPIIPLALSRGCYWNNCLFCPDRDLPYEPASHRAMDRLLSEMPAAFRARAPVIHLLDSAMPPAMFRRFLPIAWAHEVDFFGFARPSPRLMKNNLLEDAAQSGCLMLQLGAESGSEKVLDRYGKGFKPEECREIVQRAADLGIRTYLYLLFGLPDETDADRRLTLDLIADNADAVDYLNVSLFNLPRESELSTRADEFGLELGEYPDEMLQYYRPFTQNGRSPRADARRFIASEFQTHPQIRAITRRTPRWFRAAHLAFIDLPGRYPGRPAPS